MMTNFQKALCGLGGAACLAGLIAAGLTGAPNRPAATNPVPQGRDAGQAPAAAGPSVKTPVAASSPSDSSVAADLPPPLPPDAAAVPDEDLLKLAGAVNLANARYQAPDKSRWAQAIPAAQKLLAGPCDCEQRNWLNRFVEMGGHALSDSRAQYQDYAVMMVTLGRNDQDAMNRRRQANQ